MTEENPTFRCRAYNGKLAPPAAEGAQPRYTVFCKACGVSYGDNRWPVGRGTCDKCGSEQIAVRDNQNETGPSEGDVGALWRDLEVAAVEDALALRTQLDAKLETLARSRPLLQRHELRALLDNALRDLDSVEHALKDALALVGGAS